MRRKPRTGAKPSPCRRAAPPAPPQSASTPSSLGAIVQVRLPTVNVTGVWRSRRARPASASRASSGVMPPTSTPWIRTPAASFSGEPAKPTPTATPHAATKAAPARSRRTIVRAAVERLRRPCTRTRVPSAATRRVILLAGGVPLYPGFEASARPRQEDLARDDESLDLRRSLVELEELCIAHELLDGVLLHVAVAAEDLDGVCRHLHRGVGGEAFRIRGLERRALAPIQQPGGLPRQQAGGLDLGGHVGDQEVHSLVHRDRLPELRPLAGIRDGVLERRAGDADGARGGAGPRVVERAHGDLEAVALGAEPVAGGDAHVLKGDGRRLARALAELVEVALDHDAA